MRKLIFQMFVSLDGFFEGPNKEIDWHNVDNEFNAYATDMLNSVDTLIFGRVTYEMMAAYWTSAYALENDPVVAERMNNLSKIVFSRTMDKAEWNNTKLMKGILPDEIMKLKQQPGKDMIIAGSSDLTLAFMEYGLIDEYRIMIVPILLGSGKRLFEGLEHRGKLKLTQSKTFSSGNVLLYYVPE